jgi:hypothetical protein
MRKAHPQHSQHRKRAGLNVRWVSANGKPAAHQRRQRIANGLFQLLLNLFEEKSVHLLASRFLGHIHGDLLFGIGVKQKEIIVNVGTDAVETCNGLKPLQAAEKAGARRCLQTSRRGGGKPHQDVVGFGNNVEGTIAIAGLLEEKSVGVLY